MKWVLFSIVAQATTCGVLVLIYSGALVKVCRGTQYKTIIKISAFVLVANVFYTINAATLGIYIRAYSGNSTSVLGWDIALNSAWGLGDLFFCVSHWMLAVYYFNLAKNMPLVISYRGEGKAPIKDYKPLLIYGTIPNVICPLGEAIFSIWIQTILENGDPPSWL